jgi:hypothetical protein
VEGPPPIPSESRPARTWKSTAFGWLFKPFEKLGGSVLLVSGLSGIVLSAGAAWAFAIHTDGVLDLHYGSQLPFWIYLTQGLINWICMVMLLLPFGFWLGNRRFRLLELLGTQALARLPYLLAILFMGFPPVRRAFDWLVAGILVEATLVDLQQIPSLTFIRDSLLILLLSIPTLLAAVWMVWLMYHGYTKVFQLRWQQAVWSFVIALIAAEVVSKFAIMGLLRGVL